MKNCNWIEAKPSDKTNSLLLFCLFKLFKIKFPKDYLEVIANAVKNSKNIYF